ncbi:MAG: transposase family protein [Aestuariivita sp.]|nr:transposase family protein [Aestuariivita sp.]MCY4347398.1 transposase family protein [Aestuariivita sp.]
MPRRATLMNKAVKSRYQLVAENVTDPRRSSGRRHSLASVVTMVAAAKLCGMRSDKAGHDWIVSQSKAMLRRMKCREVNGVMPPPSVDRIKVIMRTLASAELNTVMNLAAEFEYAHPVAGRKGIAVDGKTLRNATDAAGQQVPIIGAHWHDDH